MTLNQILGYRAIIESFGTYGSGCGQDADFVLFDQWLSSPMCGANANRQVFIADGDQAGSAFLNWPDGATFMNNDLGAALLCDSFNGNTQDPDCLPVETAYCVRYLAAPGGVFGTEHDIDAYGNGCPDQFSFNVYSPMGTGVGNRSYAADGGGGKQMSYAQIVNESLGGGGNYRSILNGVSAHHLTLRNPTGAPDFCPRDTPSIIVSIISEFGMAMRWGFGVSDNTSIPKQVLALDLATCEGTGISPSGIEDGAGARPFVNRLYANAPNPFNPRTTLKYSLAREGPAQIVIYDVDGRRVRTLVDESRLTAGPHEAVWDGMNDRGARVGSGIYWAQMKSGSFTSNRKMVVLK